MTIGFDSPIWEAPGFFDIEPGKKRMRVRPDRVYALLISNAETRTESYVDIGRRLGYSAGSVNCALCTLEHYGLITHTSRGLKTPKTDSEIVPLPLTGPGGIYARLSLSLFYGCKAIPRYRAAAGGLTEQQIKNVVLAEEYARRAAYLAAEEAAEQAELNARIEAEVEKRVAARIAEWREQGVLTPAGHGGLTRH